MKRLIAAIIFLALGSAAYYSFFGSSRPTDTPLSATGIQEPLLDTGSPTGSDSSGNTASVVPSTATPQPTVTTQANTESDAAAAPLPSAEPTEKPVAKQLYTKPSDQELRQKLTPLQYSVTQEEGTEAPYNNAYRDNHEPGIYVDIVSGEPLFSSIDKYDSGTGWPSFTKPISASAITTKTDTHLGYTRTEVRSKKADSHLGHVFDDGPAPTGLRYCMNSAAMLFIPAAELEQKGYGHYTSLFK